MQVGILKTDGGPHPADKWARMTAWMLSQHLIEVDENSAHPKAQAIREARDDLNRRLYKALKEHHVAVQSGERAKIAEHGAARLGLPLDAADHVDVDAVVDAVVAEAKATGEVNVAEHFAKDETKAAIRQQLLRDFASVIDVERDWHANGFAVGADGVTRQNLDHDPRDPNVKAWRLARAA